MATKWYLQGLADCMDGTIDIENDTLKFMAVSDQYVFDTDHTVVDNGANDSTDPSYCELSSATTVTNYTAGWGSASRKTATVGRTVSTSTDRIDYDFASLTWTSLGGAANDTVGGVILIKEGGANDTTSRLIGYIDFTDKTTSGNDFVVSMTPGASGGNLSISIS